MRSIPKSKPQHSPPGPPLPSLPTSRVCPLQGDARTLSFAPNAAIAAALSACSPGALRHLDLSGCLEVTDEGLAPVAQLTSLRALVLHNCMKIADGAIKVCSAAGRGVVCMWGE